MIRSPDLLLPAQAQIFALEVEQQRFLAVRREVAGDTGVTVVGLAGSIYAHADGVGSGAHGKRERDGATVDRRSFVEPGMRVDRAPQLVVIAQIVIHPNIDFGGVEGTLPANLQVGGKAPIEPKAPPAL